MFKKYLDLLGDVRSNKIAITDFYFQPSSSEEEDDDIRDINREKRHNLITTLVYDPLSTDEPLVKELFLQEILNAEMDGGLVSALLRSAELLARFKNAENVWLFTRAKCANFDTACGFDYEFLVSGGIDITYNMVDNSTSELKEKFYHIVGESRDRCFISTEELAEFERNLEIRLDNSLDTIEQQISLAYELNEVDIVKEKVDQWKANKEEWTIEEARELCGYESWLGNTEGEIAANELAFTLESESLRKEVFMDILCELYLKVDKPLIAWERIKSWRASAHMESLRMIRLFELVCSFNSHEHPIAVEAFTLGMQELSLIQPGQMGIILAATAKRAAIKMGDESAYAAIEEIFQGKE